MNGSRQFISAWIEEIRRRSGGGQTNEFHYAGPRDVDQRSSAVASSVCRGPRPASRSMKRFFFFFFPGGPQPVRARMVEPGLVRRPNAVAPRHRSKPVPRTCSTGCTASRRAPDSVGGTAGARRFGLWGQLYECGPIRTAGSIIGGGAQHCWIGCIHALAEDRGRV